MLRFCAVLMFGAIVVLAVAEAVGYIVYERQLARRVHDEMTRKMCLCGLDDSGFRLDIVCPRHDGDFVIREAEDTAAIAWDNN